MLVQRLMDYESGPVRMVSAQLVRDFVRQASGAAIDLTAVLNSSGFVDCPGDRPMSPKDFAHLWRTLVAALNDEGLGLTKRPIAVGTMALLAKCASYAQTCREVLELMLEILRVATGSVPGRLLLEDNNASIVFPSDGSVLQDEPLGVQMLWVIMGGIASWLVGRRIILNQINFSCASPPSPVDYREVLRAPAIFSAPESRVCFDASYLALPVIRDRSDLPAFAAALPEGLLVRHWQDLTCSAAVRNLLVRRSPSMWPDFDELSESLSLSSSTLRRRLRREGASFRVIKNEIRRNLAVEALLKSGKSVEDIAADLGFTEPSAFYRTFRQWMSETPAKFRTSG
jgi:AraC-like DNA-binding protein